MTSRSAAKTRRPRQRTATPRARRSSGRRQRGRTAKRGSTVLRTLAVSVAVGVVVLLAGTFAAGAIVVYALTAPLSERADDPPPVAPPDPLPPSVAGYGLGQLANACTIMTAGRDLGLSERDQTIAVMTAMGESSLRNIDYGDWETNGVTNPDGSRTTSIGLFQQQDGWGSREARLDPYRSAGIFYRAMVARVPDRAQLEPTLVAHRTQVNADPQHYARYWTRALRVVAALNATPLPGDSAEGIDVCPPAA
jgi:hypothetical protein